MLVSGEKYKDGFGVEHTVMGTTKNNPDWVWTVQGCWYRRSDGRRIQYLPIDKTKPDGARRHVAAERASSWDLIVEAQEPTVTCKECLAAPLRDFIATSAGHAMISSPAGRAIACSVDGRRGNGGKPWGR